VGNEPVVSTGAGVAYGLEFFAQQKLTRKSFYTLSYTLFKSEFSGQDGMLIPSSWDNRHLLTALYGLKLPRGLELGLKFRYAGGAPFTPLDLEASQANYLSLGVGIEDLTRLNSQRLGAFSQVDLRVDKKWNYRRFTLDLYLDIQNLFLSKTPALVDYTFDRNEDGSYKTTDGQPIRLDGSNAVPLLLEDNDPFFVPTIGFIVEF